MSDVVVVVPVLDRPQRVVPLIESHTASGAAPRGRLLFVANRHDRREIAALSAAGAEVLLAGDDEVSYPAKVAAAYRATTEPHLFLAADDVHFHPGWLDAAMAKMTGNVRVVGTNDLGNPRVLAGDHSTHTLVARSYCDSPGATADRSGTVLHAGYGHWFVDDELVQVAQARGVYAHAAQAVVEHLHPYHGKAPSDRTYRRGERSRIRDRRLFDRRVALWT